MDRSSDMDQGGDTKERASAVLSVRFSAEELDDLRQRAALAGVPVSVFVRRFALERQSGAQAVIMTANPANLSADPEASSGMNVPAYSGGYVRSTGKNV